MIFFVYIHHNNNPRVYEKQSARAPAESRHASHPGNPFPWHCFVFKIFQKKTSPPLERELCIITITNTKTGARARVLAPVSEMSPSEAIFLSWLASFQLAYSPTHILLCALSLRRGDGHVQPSTPRVIWINNINWARAARCVELVESLGSTWEYKTSREERGEIAKLLGLLSLRFRGSCWRLRRGSWRPHRWWKRSQHLGEMTRGRTRLGTASDAGWERFVSV